MKILLEFGRNVDGSCFWVADLLLVRFVEIEMSDPEFLLPLPRPELFLSRKFQTTPDKKVASRGCGFGCDSKPVGREQKWGLII